MELDLVKGVGVELEGAAWPDGCESYGWKQDCSVEVYAACCVGSSDWDECECECGGEDTGEIASDVLRSWGDVYRFVHGNYPGEHDESCGLHVHVSTNLADYARLMEPEFNAAFQDAVLDLLDDLDPADADLLRPRFEGDNEYCYPSFQPLGGERYSQLNFTAYARHGTLECRLFPMFTTADVAASAIKAFLQCVEGYLAANDQTVEYVADAYFDADTLYDLELL